MKVGGVIPKDTGGLKRDPQSYLTSSHLLRPPIGGGGFLAPRPPSVDPGVPGVRGSPWERARGAREVHLAACMALHGLELYAGTFLVGRCAQTFRCFRLRLQTGRASFVKLGVPDLGLLLPRIC